MGSGHQLLQTFAALVALDPHSGQILAASYNCEEVLGLGAHTLLDKQFSDVLGSELSHLIRNALCQLETLPQPHAVGSVSFNHKRICLSIARTDSSTTIEFEPVEDTSFSPENALDAIGHAAHSIEKCQSLDELVTVTAGLIRLLMGYDHVCISRICNESKSEVLAEAKHSKMPSLIGEKIPSRRTSGNHCDQQPLTWLAHDIEREAQPCAVSSHAANLDFSYTLSAALTEKEQALVRQNGSRAFLGASLRAQNKAWGQISLFHRRPRLPNPTRRMVLGCLLPTLNSKLEAPDFSL